MFTRVAKDIEYLIPNFVIFLGEIKSFLHSQLEPSLIKLFEGKDGRAPENFTFYLLENLAKFICCSKLKARIFPILRRSHTHMHTRTLNAGQMHTIIHIVIKPHFMSGREHNS